MAADYSFSGESSTLFLMRTTIDKKNIFPAYEYLRLNMTNNLSDGSGVSFYLGAWGRADLADKTTDKYTNEDLQYAYLSYKASKNNTIVNVGRQFVTEGVAAERIDGLYLRNDFKYGIGAAAFFGHTVITEPNSQPIYQGGALVYGTRISQTDKKYYTVGLSALKSERENNSPYREEEGVDIWLRPHQQVDVTGRSTYNSITNGWMEHSYALSTNPLEQLRIVADFSQINYRDYLFNMTTSALSFANRLIDPNEKLIATGVILSYSPIKNLTVSADYKYHDYEIAKNANYYGVKAAYSFPDSISAGFGVHRMDGKTGRLRYTEYRAYASKRIGVVNVSADFTNVGYDAQINGVKNSFAITGSAGYKFNEKLKIGADLEYSQSPDFDNEVRGLLKVTYAFDTRRGEGGDKHEK